MHFGLSVSSPQSMYQYTQYNVPPVGYPGTALWTKNEIYVSFDSVIVSVWPIMTPFTQSVILVLHFERRTKYTFRSNRSFRSKYPYDQLPPTSLQLCVCAVWARERSPAFHRLRLNERGEQAGAGRFPAFNAFERIVHGNDRVGFVHQKELVHLIRSFMIDTPLPAGYIALPGANECYLAPSLPMP